MIIIKSKKELEMMRTAGHKLGAIFDQLAPEIRPGRSTWEINHLAEELIRKSGGQPNFALEDDYHWGICASVNQVLIHGIPSKSVILHEGDILSVDMGNLDDNGYNGDACRTYAVGSISAEASKLIRCTEDCFYEAFKACRPGAHLYEISMAIQKTATSYGYSLCHEYGGHGIGRSMHEDPFIYNYYDPSLGLGPFLKPGMCLAIEPMVMSGSATIETAKDGWAVSSADQKLTCHYENDIIITETGAEIISVDENVRRHLKTMEEQA
ncbi:MAG: type I methionyl aminopeptidase [Bacilli bacterium]|jgi:methionyl aminopeptidase|nr:type I methionyl aminopeptidase [Bacilli bacterium]